MVDKDNREVSSVGDGESQPVPESRTPSSLSGTARNVRPGVDVSGTISSVVGDIVGRDKNEWNMNLVDASVLIDAFGSFALSVIWATFSFSEILLAWFAVSVNQRQLLLLMTDALPFITTAIGLGKLFVAFPIALLLAHVLTLQRFRAQFLRQNGKSSPLGFAQFVAYAATWITLVIGPPFILLIFQTKFLAAHSADITLLHRIVILVDIVFIWLLWPKRLKRSNGIIVFFRFASLVALTIVGLTTSILVATFPGEGLDSNFIATTEWIPVSFKGLSIERYSSLDELFLIQYIDPAEQSRGWWTNRILLIDNQSLINSKKFQEVEELAAKTNKPLSEGERSVSFANRDLSFAYLVGADLRLADFTNTNLYGANLSGALLNGALFGCSMTQPIPRSDERSEALTESCANLQNTKFIGAKLTEANLGGVKLTSAMLQYSNMDRANFSIASLDEAILGSASALGATFAYASLKGANLREVRLSGADLSGANLQGADLEFANLRATDLLGSFLTAANLSEAKLEGANLMGAGLKCAILDSSRLRLADLSDSRIQGAEIKGADFSYANLTDAAVWRTNPTQSNMQFVKLQNLESGPVGPLAMPIDEKYADEVVANASEGVKVEATRYIIAERCNALKLQNVDWSQAREKEIENAWLSLRKQNNVQSGAKLAQVIIQSLCDVSNSYEVSTPIIERIRETGSHALEVQAALIKPECGGSTIFTPYQKSMIAHSVEEATRQ